MAAQRWQALGGTTRRYYNPTTGETLSRRQYDKLYGRFGPGSVYREQEGVSSPEQLQRHRKGIKAPPQPPQRFWYNWRYRSFTTLEAAISFVRTLRHARVLVGVLAVSRGRGGSGTVGELKWASTPVFFADQVTGMDIAGWLSSWADLGTVEESSVKWR